MPKTPIIGIIDDNSNDIIESYKLYFEPYFHIVNFDQDFKKDSILKWIMDAAIECVIIDYDLTTNASFNGVDLAYFLSDNINDFPCIILTAFATDAQQEQLIPNSFIFDKNIMEKEGQEFNNFIKTIDNAIEVFRKRMIIKEQDYKSLNTKIKAEEELSNKEIERFVYLNKILKTYGVIDEEIPAKVLLDQKKVFKDFNTLIDSIDKLIEKS